MGYKVSKDVVKSGVVKILGISFSFILSIVLARVLKPEIYGSYTYLVSLVMILSVPIQFGLPKYVLRKVAEFTAKNNKLEINNLITFSYQIMLLVALIIFSLLYIFSNYIELNLVTNVGMLLAALLGSLSLVHGNVLRGVGAVFEGNISELVIKPASVIFLVLICFQVFNEIAIETMLMLYSLALVISLAVSIYLSRKYVVLPNISHLVWKIPSLKISGSVFRNSLLPLLLISLVDILNSNTDILILGQYSSKSDIAVYKVALTLSWLFSLPRSIYTLALAPRIAGVYFDNNSEFKELINMMSQRVFLFSSILFIVLLSTCNTIIPLVYGDEYTGAAKILFLLASGHVANVSLGMGDVVLNMTGHEKSVAFLSLVSVIVNVTAALLLIPLYGIIGAAASTSLSLLIWNLSLFVLMKRKLRFYPTPFRFK